MHGGKGGFKPEFRVSEQGGSETCIQKHSKKQPVHKAAVSTSKPPTRREGSSVSGPHDDRGGLTLELSEQL